MSTWTLYKREIASYFQSMIASILLAFSALVIGIVFYYFVSNVSKQGSSEVSVTQWFFIGNPFFFIITMVQIPLVTMRVFSEEFKLGTIEMLLTAPVTEWSIVLAKFLGALTFFLLLWSPYILDITSLQTFTSPAPTLNWSQLATTAITITLIGSFYVSLGVFTSVLTRNQIVAAIICFAMLFVWLGIALAGAEVTQSSYGNIWEKLNSYVSIFNHLQVGSEGILDTRPIVFYLSSTVLMLFCTQRILLAHRLQG